MLFAFFTSPSVIVRPIVHTKQRAALGVVKTITSREYDPLQYIPINTVKAWRAHDFLVVFGIPSEDIEARRRRRNLQRTTCWQYAGVATKKNNYNGSMLVLYVAARSESHQYQYSPEMLQEAEEWHDIIALDMDEGKKITNRTIGQGGKWGHEADIGMSQKVFRWLDLALRMFPRARYVAKGDDDMFLRVPQYLADFRALPPGKTYWGTQVDHQRLHFRRYVKFTFAQGACYTMERSVARAVASFKPLRSLAMHPYNKSLLKKYRMFGMRGEDGMVGLALRLLRFPELLYVGEVCRFINYERGKPFGNFSAKWIMVHHIEEDHYEQLLKWFHNISVFSIKVKKINRHNHFRVMCP